MSLPRTQLVGRHQWRKICDLSQPIKATVLV